MGPWVVCACCSSSKSRGKQQYRYEVVYRREESLYSGPDYLESLPGGRTQLHQIPEAIEDSPGAVCAPLNSRNGVYSRTPIAKDSLVRQNQVNQQILSGVRYPNSVGSPHQQRLNQHYSAPHLISPTGYSNVRFSSRHPHPSNWRSISHLQSSPPVRFTTPSNLQASKSAPLLALHDASICSRDHSRDTSRDQSLASSNAASTRALLPPARVKPPPLVLAPAQYNRPPAAQRFGHPPHFGPRSPHTPLSPGPPAYPTLRPRYPAINHHRFLPPPPAKGKFII